MVVEMTNYCKTGGGEHRFVADTSQQEAKGNDVEGGMRMEADMSSRIGRSVLHSHHQSSLLSLLSKAVRLRKSNKEHSA